MRRTDERPTCRRLSWLLSNGNAGCDVRRGAHSAHDRGAKSGTGTTNWKTVTGWDSKLSRERTGAGETMPLGVAQKRIFPSFVESLHTLNP